MEFIINERFVQSQVLILYWCAWVSNVCVVVCTVHQVPWTLCSHVWWCECTHSGIFVWWCALTPGSLVWWCALPHGRYFKSHHPLHICTFSYHSGRVVSLLFNHLHQLESFTPFCDTLTILSPRVVMPLYGIVTPLPGGYTRQWNVKTVTIYLYCTAKNYVFL